MHLLFYQFSLLFNSSKEEISWPSHQRNIANLLESVTKCYISGVYLVVCTNNYYPWIHAFCLRRWITITNSNINMKTEQSEQLQQKMKQKNLWLRSMWQEVYFWIYYVLTNQSYHMHRWSYPVTHLTSFSHRNSNEVPKKE